MEKEVSKQQEVQKTEEPKIVNLCEDMNYHEHDQKSYEKLIQKSDNK